MKILALFRSLLPLLSVIIFVVAYAYFLRNNTTCPVKFVLQMGQVVYYDELLGQFSSRHNLAPFIWFFALCLVTIALVIWGKRFRIVTLIALSILMVVGCSWLFLVLSLGCKNITTITHIQTITFHDAIYQLAEETTDYGDYLSASYLIYACDPIGKKCVLKHHSQRYPSSYNHRPEAALLTDAAGKQLYFQFQEENWILLGK